MSAISRQTVLAIGLAGLALRAKRTVNARRDDGVIEARHMGGHHWVAYGWNERR